MLLELDNQFGFCTHFCEKCGEADDLKTFDCAIMLREYLAASPVLPDLGVGVAQSQSAPEVRASLSDAVPSFAEEAVRRERDELFCRAMLSTMDTNEVAKVLAWFNEHDPWPKPEYWGCTRCGYHGETGPEHGRCRYWAVHYPAKPNRRAAPPERSKP